jgi:hypothetical protein
MGSIIKKARVNVEYQTPMPRIEILAPDYTAVTVELNHLKSAASGKYSSQALLSYSFSEGTDDLEGGFSFTVENENVDDKGTALFDVIRPRSIIRIYEDADIDKPYPAFVGIIRKRHFGVSMTSGGPKRSVIFSGKSVISCITEFMVSLDVKVGILADAAAKTKDLTDQLGKYEKTIDYFMKKTWEHFKDVSNTISENAGAEISNGKILDDIIDNEEIIGADFIRTAGKDTKIQYPIQTTFYNQSNNYITDVWRNILAPPVYEIFTLFEESEGKSKIIARQAPFGDPESGYQDWLDLDVYEISPTSLIGYDLDQSDEEVYTVFNSYVIGSPRSKEFYMAQKEADETIQYDAAKCATYGYKLLTASFLGYDRSLTGESDQKKAETNFLTALNKKLKYWFSRLDEMYSGTITLITNFKKEKQENGALHSTNPKAGCRLKFLGGQFYITKVEHSWNYGGTPIIRLTVSRGMVYDEQTGEMKKEIPNIGKSYGELRGGNT